MSKYYKAEDIEREIVRLLQFKNESDFGFGITHGIETVDRVLKDLPTIEVSDDAISKHDLWRIVEDNAYWVTYNETSKEKGMTLTGINQALNECPPVIPKAKEVIYGNEHNCIMTLFGECSYSETGCGDCAVVEKIRKALSAEVSEDAISRATALEIYSGLYWMDERLLNFKDELDKVYEKLRNAPSVTPKPKEGGWITEEKDSIYGKKIRLTCSECGDVFDVTEAAFPYERYCRYCGAKMKGAEE